jgi:hypothetical protein
MSKTESAKSEKFVKEKETVDAGDNVDSRDHGEQDEDRSYHLHDVVCEEES